MPVHTILIVDDEANQRYMFEQALCSPQHWSIVTAADGQEALSQALAHPPDLVITDYHMVSMNGLELITELRARGVSARIFLLTAYGSSELMEAAHDLSVDRYLTKPVSLHVLRHLTAQAIGTAD